MLGFSREVMGSGDVCVAFTGEGKGTLNYLNCIWKVNQMLITGVL